MPIQVQCGHCGASFKVFDTMAGKRGLCPHCEKVVQVPLDNGGGPGPSPAVLPLHAGAPLLPPQPGVNVPARSPAPPAGRPTGPAGVKPISAAPTRGTAPSQSGGSSTRLPPQRGQNQVPTLDVADSFSGVGLGGIAASAPAYSVDTPAAPQSPPGKRRAKNLSLWIGSGVSATVLLIAVGWAAFNHFDRPNQIAAKKAKQEEEAAERKRVQEEKVANRRDPNARTKGFAPDIAKPEEKTADTRPAANASDEELAEYAEQGVVKIETTNEYGERTGLGSGFVIDKLDGCGVIATNYHVIRMAVKADVVFNNSERYGIEGYLAVQPEADLAILKLNGSAKKMRTLELVSGRDPRKLAKVFAIGHPKGYQFQVTDGKVNGVQRTSELPPDSQQFLKSFLGEKLDHSWISHSAKIAPGNSGGPLLDATGRVIGVNTWVNQGLELHFAIHSSYVSQLNANRLTKLAALERYYSPNDRNERAAIGIDPQRVARAIAVLDGMNWLPSKEDDFEHAKLVAIALTVDRSDALNGALSHLRKIKWTSKHSDAFNKLAEEDIQERMEGFVAFGSVEKLVEMKEHTRVVLKLRSSTHRVIAILPKEKRDIAKGSEVVLFGLSAGRLQSIDDTPDAERLPLCFSRAVLPAAL